jgi:hypothetical protein
MKDPQQAVPADKVLLDAKDIESLTGLGRTKTRALLRQQIIPNFRIGRVIRVSRSVFERWLEDQHRKATEEASRLSSAKKSLTGASK